MPEIGQTISHYRVIGKLGAGGMGEVVLALDDVLARKVALKFLPDVLSGEPDRLARFEREAKLLAALNHPSIATIYGLEEVEGRQFLAMEVVEGETLAQRIDRGPIGLQESAEIARQIAEALEAAHEKGIIHRDLKPANVKIAPDGKVKLLDFGLAKALEPHAEVGSSASSPTLSGRGTRQPLWSGTLLGGSSIAVGSRISPDGHTLAFQAMVDTLTQVAVMNVDSGNWTSIFNLMRNIGGSLGIAMATTVLARRQQLHTSVLGAHVDVYRPQARALLEQRRAAFVARGADLATAARQAQAAVWGLVQRQASMLSFTDVFRMMSVRLAPRRRSRRSKTLSIRQALQVALAW